MEHDLHPHGRLVRWDAQWYAGIARSGYGHTVLHPDGGCCRTTRSSRSTRCSSGPLGPDRSGVRRRRGSSCPGWRRPWRRGGSTPWGAGLGRAGRRRARRCSGRRCRSASSPRWPTARHSSRHWPPWAVHATLSRRWLLAGAARRRRRSDPARRCRRRRRSRRHGGGAVRPGPGPAPAARVGARPVGWVGYVAWVGQRTGDPLGYFRVADGWGNGFDGGRAFTVWTWHHLGDRPVAARRAPGGGRRRAGRPPGAGGPRPAAAAAAGARRCPARAGPDHVRLLRLQAALPLPAFPLLLPVAVRLSRLRHRGRPSPSSACSRPARRRTAPCGCSGPGPP